MFDLAIAWPAFLLLSPLILLAAVMIKLDSQGPVFFRQARVGQGGQPFLLVKLRTMSGQPAPHQPQLTVGDDHRITRVGRWLRASKLDELPQLFHVITGEMSLVGPRPEVPDWVRFYDQDQWEILRYKPGMTDVSSICYRNESSLLAQASDPHAAYLNHIMPSKIRMSLDYLQSSSTQQDLNILLRTLRALFIK